MGGICVIGAGVSGITAAKYLAQASLPFDWYEMSDRIGGNWAFDNPNGVSSAYRSLCLNSSKWGTQFSDFPLPDNCPAYPHHSDVFAYLNNYVDHFDLRRHIRFQQKVLSVVPEGKEWRVTFADGEARTYRAVIVASGHHWKERWAEFEGKFDGTVLHAHRYRDTTGYAGKRVVIVGIGNSAVDIACELCRVAKSVTVSTRRGAHVLPKFIGGVALDQFPPPAVQRLLVHVPFRISRALYELAIKRQWGTMTDWGLPRPDHRVLEAHPTISQDFLPLVRNGKITIKPNIERLAGDRIRFTDGSEEPADVLIYATGYEVSFPFLSEEIVSPNHLRLYHNVVPLDREGLYFVGLLQPIGSIFPLSEVQSAWVAKLLTGECKLPDRATMEARIEADDAARRRRFVKSARHSLEVDFFDYMMKIERELGHTLPARAKAS